MKKFIYILSFTFLGVLLSALIHGVVEQISIRLLLSDFDKWGLGLTWDTWYTIHYIGAIALLVLGLLLGLQQGRYWWKYIYIEKRLKKKRW